MAVSNRLCNSTPFWAEIPWDKGIVIKVAPDGMTELPYNQMEDFIESKPGYEGVKEIIDTLGLFIHDPSRDYDEQALTALRSCIKMRKEQFNASLGELRRGRAAQGITESDDAMNENLRSLGLLAFREKTEELEAREKRYRKLVGEKPEAEQRKAKTFNPELTLILTSGMPREFPSKTAKALFAMEHPEDVQSDPAKPAKAKAAPRSVEVNEAQ